MRPAKTQISLCRWTAKTDQTGRMPRLISLSCALSGKFLQVDSEDWSDWTDALADQSSLCTQWEVSSGGQRRLIRLDGCPGWSVLAVHSVGSFFRWTAKTDQTGRMPWLISLCCALSGKFLQVDSEDWSDWTDALADQSSLCTQWEVSSGGQRRLIKPDGCPGWSVSSLGTLAYCGSNVNSIL